jgi:predicted dehydrogenase
MLDLAVIGAGIMGTNHARIAASHPRVALRAVCDGDRLRADAVAQAHNASAFTSLSDLPSSIEAAVVATPTPTHAPIVIELLERGIHVLVEKPIAATVEEAVKMVEAAERTGLVLAVGHVERFNPVVLQLEGLVSDPLHFDAARISPYSGRVRDGVVLDLMIHDLDIVEMLAASFVRAIDGKAQRIHSDTEDLACALLEFESGATATITASRAGQNKIRRLEITQPANFLTVDLLRQDIQINRVAHEEFVSGVGARYRQQGIVEIPFIEARGEPLFLEMDDFVAAIADSRSPRVTGRGGLRALELCFQVLAATGDP